MYKGVDPNNVLTIPNKFFESIAAAKPIMVSNLGEKSRLVEEEGNGVSVNPDDADAVVGAIRSMRDDAGLYGKIASSAKAAQARYNWSGMAKRLSESYEVLLS
jgi:glycosyltransferase involved in cell wall biosynthesis